MSFLETLSRAKQQLREHGRVSLRALQREFGVGDEVLGELIEELVEVQQVASSDGRVLSWVGRSSGSASTSSTTIDTGERRQATTRGAQRVQSSSCIGDPRSSSARSTTGRHGSCGFTAALPQASYW
ncbi:MAG: hypothetical protein VYE73_13955 [Acidobacteriota bacterium]|nr:hypothetical protein [Acidobacteriota bacterium]